MAVTFDAVGPNSGGTSTNSGGGPTLSWSHTCSGASRLLIASVAVSANVLTIEPTISASYNGVAMTSVGSIESNAVGGVPAGYIQMFYMVAPPTGAHTVLITITNNPDHTTIALEAGSVSFDGVDQTTPYSHTTTNSGNSSSPAVTVTSATGNMVVDAVCATDTISGVSGSQTLRWLNNDNVGFSIGGAMAGAQATQSGASSVNMGYNVTSNWWGIIAIDVRAAATGVSLGWFRGYGGGQLEFLESFEGGTNGTAITSSNSQFDTFFPSGGSGSGGHFGIFDNSTSVDGVQSAKISSDGVVGDAYYMEHMFSPTTNEVYTRFAIKLTANPPINIFVCSGATGTNNAASDVRIDTGGIVSVRDNSNASAVGTTTVPLGTWFVIEYHIDATGNTQTALLYSDLKGTLQETIGGGASTYTQGTLNGLKFGLTGTGNTTLWMDAIAISRTNWIGPVL